MVILPDVRGVGITISRRFGSLVGAVKLIRGSRRTDLVFDTSLISFVDTRFDLVLLSEVVSSGLADDLFLLGWPLVGLATRKPQKLWKLLPDCLSSKLR